MNNHSAKFFSFLESVAVFTLVMLVYLFTLAPNIGMEDSAEFIASAYTLGVAHPPGFPLYMLLGKLFTYIPFGSIAWRVNLMSAVFGALTVMILYLVTKKITGRRLISACCSGLLAWSNIFWSQSIVAEVYTLNSFFAILLILILLNWRENKKDKYLLWFSFLYGLSLTNHTMMALFAPVFAGYILMTDRTIIKKFRLIIKMFLVFCLGFSVYLYLPIRSFQNPLVKFASIDSFKDFVDYVSRKIYNDFSINENLYGKLGFAIYFLVLIYEEFFLPTLLLALGGGFYLLKKMRNLGFLLWGVFLCNSLGIIFLRKFAFQVSVGYSYQFYFLPAFLVVAIWLAASLSYLYDKIELIFKDHSLKLWRGIQAIFFIMLISLPINFLIINFRKNNLSEFWFNYDYCKGVLESLEPNSVFYFSYDGSLHGDTEIFSYLYLKLVEKVRPDVAIINELGYLRQDVQLNLPADHNRRNPIDRQNEILKLLNNVSQRSVYTNFPVAEQTNNLGLFSRSNGITYKLYHSFDEAYNSNLPIFLPTIRNLDDESTKGQFVQSGLLAHYYYNLALLYLNQGLNEKSQFYLIQAFNLDKSLLNHEYYRFLQYRSDWLGQDQGIL